VHKDVPHVLKPMKKTAIKAEIFRVVVKKKRLPKIAQSWGRLCFKKGGGDDVVLSAMTSHW
jgi:hypothetical protein